MKFRHLVAISILFSFIFSSCGGEKAKAPTAENFLTLADVSGTTSFQEDNPAIRVINVKAKAMIKRNDIRLAKAKALENAMVLAVDSMVRELLPEETYNRNFAKIETYMKKNVNKYVDASEVNGERKIFNDKYYGVSASFKVNRQKVLVALQKDLRIINTSANSLITVITSKKGINLKSAGFRYSDLESALMNQIQTDLNQRGLTAMDFRNAVTSLQTDARTKARLARMSKDQFMAMIAGSKASDQLVNTQVANAEEYYGGALTLIKQLAKVVVEVNILAINGNVRGNVALSLSVTAKNIATGTGGAFANTVVNVGRRGGPNVIASALITGLVKDAYEEMQKNFIPQVIKEMSRISVGGKKLASHELIFKGFNRKGRVLRRMAKSLESEYFRYIDSSNAVPGMFVLYVRYAGKTSDLGDMIMDAMDGQGLISEEPITAPELTDLVFVEVPKQED